MRSLLFSLPLLMALHASPAQTPDWKKLIEGENLALGREFLFSPVPLYRRTTDGTESRKLTDGKWKDEALPHTKSAVGWAYVNGRIQMVLDLGESKPIGHLIARFQGGGLWPSIVLPRKIEISLSDDGENYHQATHLTKVNGGERELAAEKPDTYFYRPEVGTNFVHPFVFEIGRKARFVALHVTPEVTNLFSDEIFVMASTGAVKGLEDLPKAHFISKGVEVRPKTETLVITTNVATPNCFTVSDLRAPEARKHPVRVFVDLPEGISLKAGWRGTVTKDPEATGNRWWIDKLWDSAKPDWQGMEGPIYFIVEAGFQPPKEPVSAHFSTDEADSAANSVSVPIAFVEAPDVRGQKALQVSLAWMNEKDHAYTYPDFLNAFAHLGFSAIGTFPRNQKTPEEEATLAAFTDKVREAGLQVVYNESPFHVMEQAFAGKPEIFNQIGGKRGKHLCQTYTGPFYEKEMERVARSAAMVKPDYVFFDIELWYRSTAECRKCSRCQEAFTASGINDWDTFMHTQGTRMIRDLTKAISGTAPGGGNPLAGSYNLVPDPPIYHDIFDFRQLWPGMLNFSMPVLYVRGDVAKVHETVRRNYQAMGKRQSIPWITAGTYGEFPPIKVEQQILEAALNGASGVTYYRFQDNDPMDYVHQARALGWLAPYAELLDRGQPLPLAGGNAKLHFSAWGDEKSALLLVGNYSGNPEALGKALSIEGRSIGKLTDVQSGSSLAPDATFSLESDRQRLLYVEFVDRP